MLTTPFLGGSREVQNLNKLRWSVSLSFLDNVNVLVSHLRDLLFFMTAKPWGGTTSAIWPRPHLVSDALASDM